MMSKLAWLFILTAASGHKAPEDSAQCGNETASLLQTAKSNSFLSLIGAVGDSDQELCGAGSDPYPGPLNSCGITGVPGACECNFGSYTLSSTMLPPPFGIGVVIEAPTSGCWFIGATKCPTPGMPPFPETCKFDDLSTVFSNIPANFNNNTICMKVPAGVEVNRSCVKGAGNDEFSKRCSATSCYANETATVCDPPPPPGCSDGEQIFCVATDNGAPSNAGFNIKCCDSSTSSTSSTATTATRTTESGNDPSRTTTTTETTATTATTATRTSESGNDPSRTTTASTASTTETGLDPNQTTTTAAATTTTATTTTTTTKKKYNRRIRRIRRFRRYRGYNQYS